MRKGEAQEGSGNLSKITQLLVRCVSKMRDLVPILFPDKLKMIKVCPHNVRASSSLESGES